MTVILPKGEINVGTNEWSHVYSNDLALKNALETTQTELTALIAESPVTSYTPKVIATEQTRESTSYGTLTTADEIKSVVVPANALVEIGYRALAKVSVEVPANAAIFIGATQLKAQGNPGNAPAVQQAGIAASNFRPIGTAEHGLTSAAGAETWTGDVTTGQALSLTSQDTEGAVNTEGGIGGGVCTLFNLAAGTYDISVKYKASVGKVTVKSRALWVRVVG